MVISKGDGEASIKSTSGTAQIGSSDASGGFNAALTFTNTNVEVTGDVLRSYTVSGGSVTVNTGSNTSILAKLSANETKTDLLVTGSNKEEGQRTEATFGGTDVTLGKLTMDADTTVTLGDHNHTLALESLTVNGSGSVINANLEISDGTMTMSSSVEMGCSITLGANGKEALVLTNGVVDGDVLQSYTLFTNVESLTLGNGAAPVAMGWYDASTVINSITVGTGATATTITPANCVIGYWNGTVTISDRSVPEPATATLSLLALAALAARRKRK